MSEAALTKALIEMGRQCIQAEEERDAAIARAEKAKADIKLWKGVVEQERSARGRWSRCVTSSDGKSGSQCLY